MSFVHLAKTKFTKAKIAYLGSFSDMPEYAFIDLVRNKVKIIVGLFGEKNARNVLCQVSV